MLIFPYLHTRTLRRCAARWRLVLSGTPVQNRLEELYALVDFVYPNYLGKYRYIRGDMYVYACKYVIYHTMP
jgi:SNF2 family DNA or RNA helicase